MAARFEPLPVPGSLGLNEKRYFKFDVSAGTFRACKDKACTKFKRTYNVSDVKDIEPSLDDDKDLKIRAVADDGKEHKLDIAFKSNAVRNQFLYLLHYIEATKDPKYDPKKRYETLKVFIGTWNVGNAPPPEDFSTWIPLGKYDVYVVGCQECKYDARKGFKSCKDDWDGTLTKHMGDKYVLVHFVTMWQIRLSVYIRKELRKYISGITYSSEATGIGSMLGNKGGVGVSFLYKGNSFCFINSHLAAHQEMIEERNEDVCEIIDNIKLGTKKTVSENPDVCSAFRHLFWMGDLNYRIDSESRVDVCKDIKDGKLEKLYKIDQLVNQMKANKVFYGFNEGPVHQFRPTYKFEPNKPHVDYTEDRNRVPSWCDRVLWTSWPSCNIKQTLYGCTHEMITSDHSPVHAAFDIDILLPFVPQEKSKHCKIVISDLEISGLEKGADPYIVIRKGSTFMEKDKTKALRNIPGKAKFKQTLGM